MGRYFLVEYFANIILEGCSAIGRIILGKPLLSLGSQYLPVQITQLNAKLHTSNIFTSIYGQ
jgi:hypothetical protein